MIAVGTVPPYAAVALAILFALAMTFAVLALIGAVSATRAARRAQPFSDDTEAAIRQNMRLFGRRRAARPTQAEVDMQIARMELDEYGQRRDGVR